MPILAVSDSVWTAAITATATVVLAVLQIISKRDILRFQKEARDEHRAHEAMTADSGKKIDVLVEQANGAMTERLREHAETARTLADMTKKKQHVLNAEKAEKELREHLGERDQSP